MSFMQLLKQSEDSEYIMFCDQDDIWSPNKVELSLDKIRILEGREGDIPLLVFTDLSVVNNQLDIIQKSFWEYQKLNPEYSVYWKEILAQNVITGCTIIMNKRATEVSLPFELPHMIHDQWIGANVAKYGIIDYLPIQTILYRQHGANVAGAHRFGFQYILQKLLKVNTVISQLKTTAQYFEEVTVMELLYYKCKINLKRFIRR
jgi:hypothetical protein